MWYECDHSVACRLSVWWAFIASPRRVKCIDNTNNINDGFKLSMCGKCSPFIVQNGKLVAQWSCHDIGRMNYEANRSRSLKIQYWHRKSGGARVVKTLYILCLLFAYSFLTTQLQCTVRVVDSILLEVVCLSTRTLSTSCRLQLAIRIADDFLYRKLNSLKM